MGMVYAEITLKNYCDEVQVNTGVIKPEDIRTATVTAMVDTGSMNLVITEELCQKLGLAIKGKKPTQVASGHKVMCKVTDVVEVCWKNRETYLPALVVPGTEQVLLGAIPLEIMDLTVNPCTQELVGVHGDEIEYIVF